MANEIRNRWAFLVGVNHYRESSRFGSLRYCVNDVKALGKLLKQVGYGVICLHDQLKRDDERFPDTANTVIAELRKLQDKIGSDDLLLVYFACHGTRSLLSTDERPYLILRDTRSTIPETALAVARLKAEMQEFKAERQVIILDACHMGVGKDDRGDTTEAARQFIQNVHELATGFALLTPSTAQQTTRESDDLQHGVFSSFVLSGLSGEGKALVHTTESNRGFVTLDSLRKYVFNEMLIWSVEQGYEQIPQGQTEGDLGDFMLVDYRQQLRPETSVYNPNNIDRSHKAMTVDRDALINDYDCAISAVSIDWRNSQATKLLRQSILAVYPDRIGLAMFLNEELSKNLDEIAITGSLTSDTFQLIKKANAQNWIGRLYEAFCKCNCDKSQVLTLQRQLSAFAIVELEQTLPEDLDAALAAIAAIEAPSAQTTALLELAPQMEGASSSLLARIVKVVQGIENKHDRLNIFSTLLQYLPERLQTQIKERIDELEEQTGTGLVEFEFEAATLVLREGGQTACLSRQIDNVWEVRKTRQTAFQFIESLNQDIRLEMVAIPAGSFTMGSSESELDHYMDEAPQHEVRLKTFFMSRYPITQAQWRFVSGLEQVQHMLDANLSRFKGDDLPIEQVSWHEAVEFCDRLSRCTGKEYALPSEAQWEYACRAGTQSPFSFGSTISSELANYRGTKIYNDGPKGEYREETTPVDCFAAENAFGLCDMHGNVWEWCADHWHDSYAGAPVNGSAWITENKNANRVSRGGSWVNSPGHCRSAAREEIDLNDRNIITGFRVCCLALKTL